MLIVHLQEEALKRGRNSRREALGDLDLIRPVPTAGSVFIMVYLVTSLL
jgi:hypothetical protein